MYNFINSPVIGIDISKNFHYVTILKPNGDLYRKPFKILNNLDGFNYLFTEIKKVEKEFNTSCPTFMESTGVYHITLFHFLKKHTSEAYIINPLITNSTKNKNIRKVKNDRNDSISIAKLGKYENIKAYDYLDTAIFDLKSLVREHIKQVDTATMFKHKIDTILSSIFPNYIKVFDKPYCATSLTVLTKYPTASLILNAEKETLIDDIDEVAKKGRVWAEKKYNLLIDMAKEADIIGIKSIALKINLLQNISLLMAINKTIHNIKLEISNLVNDPDFPATLFESIELIDSIPGFDFMTAVTMIAEIGDYTRFKKPKHLVAFLGLDPSVSQSGSFTSTHNKMSKRGSQAARKALFTAALVSIRKKRNGEYFNKILYTYYNEKPDKEKKVRLGAIMHKLINYIFSVLRDRKSFEIRNPKLHAQMYLSNHSKQVA